MVSTEFKASASLNLMNFLFYGGLSCIVPFLSLHMRILGLTLWHMAWVHVTSGLVCILVPLFIGTVAERPASSLVYKLCFSLSLMFSVFCSIALLAVPKVQRTVRQPLIDFDCASPLNAVINLEKCANWETCSHVAKSWSPNTYFRLSHCRSESGETYPNNTRQPLHLCFRSTTNTTNLCLVYDPHFRANSWIEFISDLSSWQYTEYRNVSAKEFSFSNPELAPSSLNVCNFMPANTGTLIRVHNQSHDSVFCRWSTPEDRMGIKCLISLHMEGEKPLCYDIVGDVSFTFWMYLATRAAADAFIISSVCLLEGITLRTIQDGPYHRGAYGRTRTWPAVAFFIFPIVAGAFVDYFPNGEGVVDYSPAFFISAAIELATSFLVYILPLNVGGSTVRYEVSAVQSSEKSSNKYGISLEIVVISIVAVFAGIAWGVEQVYDPLLYQEFGFNHLLIGSCTSIGYFCAIPFLFVSKNLVENIGEIHLISSAFAFHSIHLAGLSFIKEWMFWWWAGPFEAMKAFTVPIMCLSLVATVEHENKTKKIAVQYVLIIMHFCIGRLLGSAAGGLIGEYFSFSLAYRIVSVFCAIVAISYLLLHHCYMKPRHHKIVAQRTAQHRQPKNDSYLLLDERVNGMISSPAVSF